jgi:hypothetical protein
MAYKLTPFEKDLAAFADRIGIVVGLEIGDKMTADDAYKEIKLLVKDLKKSRKLNNGVEDEQAS